MENKSSKEYVAKLLQQLEELKKKKARKERKLQKLKISGHVDQQKKKSSLSSFNEACDQLLCTENSSSFTEFEKSDSSLHKKEICRSVSISECTKTIYVDDEKNKGSSSIDQVNSECNENFVCNSRYSPEAVGGSTHIPEKSNHKHLSANENCGAFTIPLSEKSNILHAETDIENFCSVKHSSSFHGDSLNIEKSNLKGDELKFNKNVSQVKEININSKANGSSQLPVDLKGGTSSVVGIINDITLETSPCGISNKSSSNSKDKTSDILDDSLNSNMSFFLSSELFPANEDKQEITPEEKSSVTHIPENTKETGSFPVPVIPDTVTSKALKSNLSDFSFPKFSTPTEGINFLSSSDENVINSQTCEAGNKFDPKIISSIIGKGLSSVLDAHYQSPNKSQTRLSSDINQGISAFKKRKLFSERSCESDFNDLDFDAFSSHSVSFCGSTKAVSYENNSSGEIPSQVTKTVNGLVDTICKNSLFKVENIDKNMKADSEILVIPETEGLGLNFLKDTEDFLETSTLSENLENFHVKDNLLNVSSQSRLESPVVNQIVAAVKSAKDPYDLGSDGVNKLTSGNMKDENAGFSNFNNSLGMDTSFLEDDTQELGKYKQVPYMDEKNVQDILASDGCKTDSNLNFICSLYGASNEEVLDVEIIVFSNVKYAFIQHKTQIHVWRQEKAKEWIKIFSHQIEDTLSLVKICSTRDEDNLVIVMLLCNEEQYCLQFLLFERNVKVIKLMENTHWLEERHSGDSVLLCGLEGLMFATGQPKEGHEVSIHAFVGLGDSPRLMTAVLGSTDSPLCSLCKINNLPNALLGMSDSMLYVWHILEARLVTSVSLHPHDYLPINQCFWATVENGLIYLLTTCKGPERHRVCQLLAANLATGFCQSAMTYSSRPSTTEMPEITKAVYLEPFLVVSHSDGALMWSVVEEHCCASLPSKHGTTSVALSRDFENWGLVAVGSRQGYLSCYSLN